MLNPNFDLVADLRAKGFDIHDYTKPVYKYVSVEAAKSILSNCQLRFRPPISFNDPFEFSLDALDFRLSETEYRQNIVRALLNDNQNIPLDELHYKVATMTKEQYVANYISVFEGERENSLLFCASEINDQTLMWSHYADCHKGFCLGLIWPIMAQELYTLRVNYIDTITPKRILSPKEVDFRDAVNYWMFTKAKAWEYEKEVRTVITTKTHINRNGYDFINMNMNPQQVVEVYAGVKTSRKDIEDVKTIIKERNYPVDTFGKMRMKKNSFQLEIMDI